MNIDDFLKRKKFRNLDEYLTDEMHKRAGDDLVSQMIDVFETKEDARNWFYSPLIALGGKRPYDLCKEGNIQEVENELGRIEHGIYS